MNANSVASVLVKQGIEEYMKESSYRDGGYNAFFKEKIRQNRTISLSTVH